MNWFYLLGAITGATLKFSVHLVLLIVQFLKYPNTPVDSAVLECLNGSDATGDQVIGLPIALGAVVNFVAS